MNKTPPPSPRPGTLVFPLPQPDTVFSGESLLPPMLSTPGRCPCCRRTVTHRFIWRSMASRWLTPAGIRSSCWKNLTRVMRLKKHPVPENADEKKRNTPEPCRMPERSPAQARLSAGRLALRHVEKSQIVTTDALSENESELLQPKACPFHLCAFLPRSALFLNGYAAAQGVMVWLPDLHPASVVCSQCTGTEIFSDERKGEGRDGPY